MTVSKKLYKTTPGVGIKKRFNKNLLESEMTSICANFLRNPTVHPITGLPLYPGSAEYNSLTRSCGGITQPSSYRAPTAVPLPTAAYRAPTAVPLPTAAYRAPTAVPLPTATYRVPTAVPLPTATYRTPTAVPLPTAAYRVPTAVPLPTAAYRA